MARFSLLFALVLASAACGAATDAAAPRATETAKEAALPVRMPEPGHGRGVSALAQNAACEGCHREVAAEWRASLHRVSESSPTYRRAFVFEPMPFCTRCHAPEAEDPAAEVAPAVAEVGVGCVTCHVVDGEILAAPAASGTTSDGTTHAVRRDARFATADACASCHEFEFPDRASRSKPEFMQSTISEFRASPFASGSCADCHMPKGPGNRRSHDFSVSRNEAMVRSAARVEASRPSASRVIVRFTPGEIGHAFPTGDLFRRIEVLAEVVGEEYSLVEDKAVYLARHFESRKTRFATTRVLAKDDRVFPGSGQVSVVELSLGPLAEGRSVAYRVAYQRVDNTRRVDDRDAPMDGEIVLAQGVLPP